MAKETARYDSRCPNDLQVTKFSQWKSYYNAFFQFFLYIYLYLYVCIHWLKFLLVVVAAVDSASKKSIEFKSSKIRGQRNSQLPSSSLANWLQSAQKYCWIPYIYIGRWKPNGL